jgi:hypothetical protein
MMASTSLPELPDPASVHDEPSASDALFGALATVAAANRKSGFHRDLAAFHKELTTLFRSLHELLPTIAEYRRDITSWSVTVGMSNTLTVNIAARDAEAEPIPGLPGQK